MAFDSYSSYNRITFDPRRDRYVGGREAQIEEAYRRGLINEEEVNLAFRGMMDLGEIMERRERHKLHEERTKQMMKDMMAYKYKDDAPAIKEPALPVKPLAWLDTEINKVRRLAR